MQEKQLSTAKQQCKKAAAKRAKKQNIQPPENDKNQKRVLRTCVACRLTTDKHRLIRIVRLAEGEVVLDANQKCQGRAMYLCKSLACIQRAEKSQAIKRHLKVDGQNALQQALSTIADKQD